MWTVIQKANLFPEANYKQVVVGAKPPGITNPFCLSLLMLLFNSRKMCAFHSVMGSFRLADKKQVISSKKLTQR